MRTSAITIIDLELGQPDIIHRPLAAQSVKRTECGVAVPLTLRLANCEFHQAERKLGKLCATLTQAEPAQGGGLSDAAILASLPGIGRSTLSTLLTEAGGPPARRDYAALRTLTGVAPMTKRSGKTCIVVMRYAAQVRLRQAVFD